MAPKFRPAWLRRLTVGARYSLFYGGAAAVLVLLGQSSITESIDLLLYDFVASIRPSSSGEKDPIAIIGISESDLKRYGWPVDDRYLCEGIEKLLADGSVAIGLDLYRDQGVGANRECLNKLYKENPKLVSIFNEAEQIPAIPGTPPERQAYNDLLIDPDATLRRDLVHVAGQTDPRMVSFPMRLLEVATGSTALRDQLEADTSHTQWLHPSSGGYRNADAGGLQQMLPYRQLGSFPLWSLEDLLTGKVPASTIKNRVVLIGTTAPSLRDLFTVSQTRFMQSTSQFQVPGVEIHAHRLASLLDRTQGRESRLIRTASPWMNSGLEVVAILLGILLGNSFLSIRKSVTFVFLGTSLFVVMGFGALYFFNFWAGITLPAISFLVMGTVAWIQRGTLSQQHRQQIERLLGQATSPEVAQKLWENRDNLLSEGRFEGRQLTVTVMFSDIAGFTTVSEGMRPNDLLDWINRGMRTCISSIVHSGGIVNKFTGDGFLAAFGAPVSHGEREDACFAVKVALEIADHLENLNFILATEGKPPMRLRIGIHTGPVVAGSMGGTERLEYCILGDAVNCASRLESIEKQRHEGVCRILVSGDTRQLVESSQPHLNWKEWGYMHLKGRNQPLQIWELLSSSKQLEQISIKSTPAALLES